MGYKKDEIIFQFEPFICLAKSVKPTEKKVLKVWTSFYDPLIPYESKSKNDFQLLFRNQYENIFIG